MKFLRHSFLFSLLLVQLVVAKPALSSLKGTLYYSGLAENGWQVYQWDGATQKEKQLTSSAGDKRAPLWVPSMQRIVYRDAMGQICSVDLKGNESQLVKGVRTSAHFTVSPDGKDIYYTRLLANNPLRQSLWHASAADDFSSPELIFRMPRGSIRNVCFDPTGNRLVMSHVWRDNEERLLILNVKDLASDPNTEPTPITSEFVTAAFPRYSQDGTKIHFSKRVERGNYDLFTYDVSNKKTSTLLAVPETSELYPYVSSDGRWLFYEMRENAGNAISLCDLETKEHSVLQLPRPAKEPCYIK